MNAIILSIGDELVLGQTIDTNSAWLSAQLASIGCVTSAHMTVGDDQHGIEQAIRHAAPQCDWLIITGGLGPTADDLTRQALAAVMQVPLELNEQWLAELDRFFKARNRPMPPTNRIQAMIPRDADMIWNQAGTAAGIHAILNPASSRKSEECHVFVLPGVPKEMRLMFERDVRPKIETRANGGVILSRTLHTFGLGESSVAERLGNLMERTRNPSVGTTVSGGVVSIRINARFASRDDAWQQLEATVQQCRAALGDLIYGQDEQSLQEAVALLLKQAGQTVTSAESCTGGLLAKVLTDVPGSSAYFRQGWITYANDAKSELLGVTIGQGGAVSEDAVRQMAIGARQRSGADFALAISGIAGPDGGTPQKPVGTVCIGLATLDHVIARTFNFPGDREMIRDRSAKMALTMLRYRLLGQAMPF